MIASSSSLDSLKRARPEWGPWLGVLEAVVREDHSGDWERAVRGSEDPRLRRMESSGSDGVPLLEGISVSLRPDGIRRLAERVLRLASADGAGAMESLAALRVSDANAVELFTSSIRHDMEPARRLAAARDTDPEALQAVVALLPVPFLLACNRRLARSVPAGWTKGYCPVCGSWPAFAEIRGIERSRCFRCARCGGEWHARALVCPFCELDDHDELAALVPAKSAHAVIDACNGCRGYVKAFTRLQGCPPASVMIDDLASVDLDMAAIEQGYARPAGAGYPVGVTVAGTGERRRLFGWGS
jgi:FdhE protein